MIMMKKSPCWVILFTVCFCFFYVHANEIGHYGNFDDEEGGGGGGSAVGAGGGPFLVKRDQRRLIVSTEYGQISAVKIPNSDGRKGITGSYYHLQFITLEPNALLLPLLLHADMLFYVNTGSARLSYVDYDEDENELQHIDLSRGDVYRLQAGTLFFIQSNLETERQKLRIYAIFNENSQEIPSIKAYSSVQDLLLGFDKRVLQAAFNVPEDVITELKSGQPQPLIVHGVQKAKKNIWEVEAHLMRSLLGSRNYGMFDFSNKGKKNKVFNILKAKPDVENCNGWSLSVTKKQSKALKLSDMGVFMVNLTKGSMMGPHWNPMATEIGVVLQGRGMIRIVCSSNTSETGCENMRFRVEEGDVFAIPRFHPMAQISFNNESFVFMGFTTASKKNHPQFLAGKRSVLQTLDKLVLAASFQVSNETIERLLAPQEESIILECTSCAENEEAVMEEEIEREREEERRREEEEGRKREEEKRREEEEARKREEEEAKRREEEARRREEEQEEEARRKEKEEAARKREEEEARRREEEKRKREEASRKEEERRKHEAEQEEEAARRQEEEARQQEEESERQEEERRRQEEEASRKQEEEAERQQQEERERQEEEEAQRREEKWRKREAEQEEEAARKQEEEAARQQEEERERRQEEEAQRREEKRRKREAEQEEEAARKQEEEAARQQEEEKERQQEEEAQRREEKRRKREAEQEAAAARKQEEAARQQEEEKERRQEEEAQRREEKRRKREAEQEAAAARKQEEEAARQQEEEKERRQEEEGEAGHGEQEEEEGEEAAARREDEERQKRAAEEEAEARERETEEGEGRRIPRRFRRV